MRLFLVSTQAGGLGINLPAANRVVIFDVSWNPSHDLQSIYRVYRLGQTKPVYIYRLIAKGTMEEKIYDRQVTKQSLSARIIDEHQIERHFRNSELKSLYEFKEYNTEAKPQITKIPDDNILDEILLEMADLIWHYHDHDSLLENKTDEVLSKEEQRQAWLSFKEHQDELKEQMKLRQLLTRKVQLNTFQTWVTIPKKKKFKKGTKDNENNEGDESVMVPLDENSSGFPATPSNENSISSLPSRQNSNPVSQQIHSQGRDEWQKCQWSGCLQWTNPSDSTVHKMQCNITEKAFEFGAAGLLSDTMPQSLEMELLPKKVIKKLVLDYSDVSTVVIKVNGDGDTNHLSSALDYNSAGYVTTINKDTEEKELMMLLVKRTEHDIDLFIGFIPYNREKVHKEMLLIQEKNSNNLQKTNFIDASLTDRMELVSSSSNQVHSSATNHQWHTKRSKWMNTFHQLIQTLKTLQSPQQKQQEVQFILKSNPSLTEALMKEEHEVSNETNMLQQVLWKSYAVGPMLHHNCPMLFEMLDFLRQLCQKYTLPQNLENDQNICELLGRMRTLQSQIVLDKGATMVTLPYRETLKAVHAQEGVVPFEPFITNNPPPPFILQYYETEHTELHNSQLEKGPSVTNIPPPPSPPDNPQTDEERRQQELYVWVGLVQQECSINEQLKYYETEITMLRKKRKSLNSKQRTKRKNGNELGEIDSSELNRVTADANAIQKTLEKTQKQFRQHTMIMNDHREKKQKAMKACNIKPNHPTMRMTPQIPEASSQIGQIFPGQPDSNMVRPGWQPWVDHDMIMTLPTIPNSMTDQSRLGSLSVTSSGSINHAPNIPQSFTSVILPSNSPESFLGQMNINPSSLSPQSNIAHGNPIAPFYNQSELLSPDQYHGITGASTKIQGRTMNMSLQDVACSRETIYPVRQIENQESRQWQANQGPELNGEDCNEEQAIVSPCQDEDLQLPTSVLSHTSSLGEDESTSISENTQLGQLQAQIVAYGMLSRYQPLPPNIERAALGEPPQTESTWMEL